MLLKKSIEKYIRQNHWRNIVIPKLLVHSTKSPVFFFQHLSYFSFFKEYATQVTAAYIIIDKTTVVNLLFRNLEPNCSQFYLVGLYLYQFGKPFELYAFTMQCLSDPHRKATRPKPVVTWLQLQLFLDFITDQSIDFVDAAPIGRFEPPVQADGAGGAQRGPVRGQPRLPRRHHLARGCVEQSMTIPFQALEFPLQLLHFCDRQPICFFISMKSSTARDRRTRNCGWPTAPSTAAITNEPWPSTNRYRVLPSFPWRRMGQVGLSQLQVRLR